jgi:AP2 domain./HNH endonuclease.
MITQQDVTDCFEYRDGYLYWKGVSHPNKQHMMDKPAGSIHKTGYRHITWRGKVQKAHRLIFMLHYGYLPPEVDHINGDRADNRIENLRPATRSENQCNRNALASNTSGYPGVSWHKASKAWVVRVMKNGKTVVQQYCKDLELAGLVATEARSLYHGAYAKS